MIAHPFPEGVVGYFRGDNISVRCLLRGHDEKAERAICPYLHVNTPRCIFVTYVCQKCGRRRPGEALNGPPFPIFAPEVWE